MIPLGKTINFYTILLHKVFHYSTPIKSYCELNKHHLHAEPLLRWHPKNNVAQGGSVYVAGKELIPT